MLRKLINVTFIALVISCGFACQDFVQKSNDWLKQPLSTQKSGVTREDAIKGGGAVVGVTVPQPYGAMITGGLAALLTILHNLDSRKRTSDTQQKISDLSDAFSTLKHQMLEEDSGNGTFSRVH